MKSLYSAVFLLFSSNFIGYCSSFVLLHEIQKDFDFLFLTSTAVQNEKCRTQSLLYLKELNKFTDWATEMFDSSAKFPNGILTGAAYHFGNFDQCLDIDVTVENEKISGKYCLPTFEIELPYFISNDTLNENYQYMTVWDKLAIFSTKRSKLPRNIIRLGICMPSTCTDEDLLNHLNHILANYPNIHVFLGKHSCQTNKPEPYTKLETGMYNFLLAITALTAFSTIYELFIEKKEHSQSIIHQILISFSLVSNIAKLFTVKQTEDKLEAIHGIRFWSMFFTIMVHHGLTIFASPIMNAENLEASYHYKAIAGLLNGTMLIDAFYTLTGFLASYFILLQLQEGKKLNPLSIIAHRLLRLIPLYVFIILFYSTLFIRIGSGPIWKEKLVEQRDNCLSNWWLNILYLNNYFNVDTICILQSWYIAANMQMFFLSPFIALWMHNKPQKTIKILKTAIVVFTIISFLQVYITNLDPIQLAFHDTFKDVGRDKSFQTIYAPTHNRVAGYLIGMLGGYYKLKMKNENRRIPRNLITIGWIFVIISIFGGLILGHIFYQEGRPNARLEAALYSSLHHILIGLSILWFIFAVSDQKGVYIGIFLDPWIFTPFSRLTYSVYLSHLIIPIWVASSLRSPVYISILNYVYWFWGNFIWTYVLGCLLSMMFEAPIYNIENIIKGKGVQSALVQYFIERREMKKIK